MANKSANIYARIEPDIKKQAETILAALGLSPSNAINMFYKQIIIQNGIPFELKLPNEQLMKIEETLRLIESNDDDDISVDDIFEQVRKEHGI